MGTKPNIPFRVAQEQLFETIFPEDLSELSDDELGDMILNFTLKRERIRHGYDADDTEATAELDLGTYAKLKTWDTDDPALIGIEKVLRRLVEGRKGDGASLLKRIIQSKAEAQAELISVEQRRKASTPRDPHPVDTLILSILDAEQGLTVKEIERKLKTYIGGGIILDIDDEQIELVDGKYKAVNLSGLNDRVTRIKKKNSH
mgnify:CR=1 FL=1